MAEDFDYSAEKKYVLAEKEKEKADENQIRVRKATKVVKYVRGVLNELEKNNVVRISGSNNAIAKAINLSEFIRRKYDTKLLHKYTRLGSKKITDVYLPLEKGLEEVRVEKYLSIIEIVLSTEKQEKLEGFFYEGPLAPREKNAREERNTSSRGRRTGGARDRREKREEGERDRREDGGRKRHDDRREDGGRERHEERREEGGRKRHEERREEGGRKRHDDRREDGGRERHEERREKREEGGRERREGEGRERHEERREGDERRERRNVDKGVSRPQGSRRTENSERETGTERRDQNRGGPDNNQERSGSSSNRQRDERAQRNEERPRNGPLRIRGTGRGGARGTRGTRDVTLRSAGNRYNEGNPSQTSERPENEGRYNRPTHSSRQERDVVRPSKEESHYEEDRYRYRRDGNSSTFRRHRKPQHPVNADPDRMNYDEEHRPPRRVAQNIVVPHQNRSNQGQTSSRRPLNRADQRH